MTKKTTLRDIKMPSGLSLKSFRPSGKFSTAIDKHKKKIALGLAIVSIGCAGAFVAHDLLFPAAAPQIQLASFAPEPQLAPPDGSATSVPSGGDAASSVVQQTPAANPAELIQTQPPIVGSPDTTAPVTAKNTQIHGSGVVQQVATNTGVQPSPVAEKQSVTDQLAQLNERLAAQDTKIAQIQEETNRLKAQLDTKVRETKKPAPTAGNGFNVNRLNLLSISPEYAVVKTAQGSMTVKPGSAFPGGVVFISYDPTSHVLKTTAGEFLVQS